MVGSFIIIGENLHTTRSYRRKGKRIYQFRDGKEAIRYRAEDGEFHYLPIPGNVKDTQDYEEGRIKHIKVALRHCIDNTTSREEAEKYLETIIKLQIENGASFLDINVDEISLRLEEQKMAMCWLVAFAKQKTPLPLSIDSSSTDILTVGIKTYINGEPQSTSLINSASLERQSAIDLAVSFNTKIIVSAAGKSRIPNNAEDRINFATQIIETALAKGIPISNIYVDPLVFPVAVNHNTALHTLATITEIRRRYGDSLHITGGFSNASFGLPMRNLINKVFLFLAIKSGADSGIIDPINIDVDKIESLDRSTKSYQMTENLILGKDEYCAEFLKSYRKGELSESD